ncbi:transglutaminase family protein [Stutzerimonas tarimensis]|uniref:Transglutaminase domain-containing protein n=1 Tax=Stutzerimonas tarimensis TaxID=1507735 RepID=A0ABV7T8T8_9GAMM
MRISISHDTTYLYEHKVRGSIQYLRLTPHESTRQHVIQWDLDLPRPVRPQLDAYGNILHVLSMDEPHNQILIHARGLVEIDVNCEAEGYDGSPLPFLRFTPLTQPDDALRLFAARNTAGKRTRGALIDLMMALREHMSYTPGSTGVESTAAEAFAGRAGVCQDHSHAFLACARSLGIPARYISGYLFTDDAEHLASHAWVEAWVEDAWYSFDVTNGLARPERHLKLAVGQDYLDACPIRGVRRGGGVERMHAKVLVSPGEVHIQEQ